MESVDESNLESWKAAVLILNVYVGMDMLSMPVAFVHAGPTIGVIIVAAICLINIYSSLRLLKICNYLNASSGRADEEESTVSYAEISQVLFVGVKARHITRYSIEIIQSMLQLGICISYIVFIADHLADLVGVFNVRIWIAILFPLLLGESMLNMKLLAYISSLSLFALVIGLVVIFKYLYERVPFSKDEVEETSIFDMAFAISQVMFIFSDVPVIVPVQRAMKRPHQLKYFFPVILVFITIIDILLGYSGAIVFGLSTRDSIMQNMPKSMLYQAVRLLFALMTFFTYPVNLYPVVEIARERLDLCKGLCSNRCYEVLSKKWLLKVLFVTMTCLIAIAFPSLGNILAFIGGFAGTILALVLPPLLHLRLMWLNYEMQKIGCFLDVYVLMLGVVICAFGTVSVIYKIT